MKESKNLKEIKWNENEKARFDGCYYYKVISFDNIIEHMDWIIRSYLIGHYSIKFIKSQITEFN